MPRRPASRRPIELNGRPAQPAGLYWSASQAMPRRPASRRPIELNGRPAQPAGRLLVGIASDASAARQPPADRAERPTGTARRPLLVGIASDASAARQPPADRAERPTG